ncbi:hypothetical protein BBO_01750 [Beauveria brongniartii RCEF 3172]|uniref:Uncharacterized protein n=1 Tax=Beauveria brongniartii RCEF 3172 TaxID=1081107 RepID=A0A167JDL4_9HYPO|nr:hypothetical protein BBO_01750 [Beauveria brongniartii RCEF 3172]
MAEVVEFYITCNPPLLPRGVSEVIRRVQDAEGLLEILYEPRSPWFKCIALSSERRQITAAVQDNLFAIAKDDVDTLDFDEKTDGDISIISPDPRMTSWHEYRKNWSDAYAFADCDIFPEFIAESKHKTTWYGLEDHPSATFDGLLAPCGMDILLDAEQFQLVYKCRISYNLRQTVLYIGTDESREAIDTVKNAYGTPPKLLPLLEVIPAAEMERTASNGPFDDIPSDVNESLPRSITFQDPFNNLESLI